MDITPEQEMLINRVKIFVKETTEQQEALYQELVSKIGIEKPEEDFLFDFIFNPDFVRAENPSANFGEYLNSAK